jgi:glycosyltransferase involved in cell wall biosynthesis
MAAEDPRIRILDNPARRTPNGLNVGLRAARGEFIARMDAHTQYPSDYLARGVQRLRRGDVAWVSGPQIPHGEGKWSRRVAAALRSRLGTGGALYREMPEGEIEVGSGFTGVWARASLERNGGWDEGWPVNQDAELAARIRGDGERIVCLPEMAARYIPRDSLRTLVRQYRRYGFYRAKTCRHHPWTLRASHLMPPGLLVALVTASSAPGRLRWPPRAAVAAYVVAVLAVTAETSRREGWRDAGFLPLVFPAMHLAWGLGFLAGCARFGVPVPALARLLLRRRAT